MDTALPVEEQNTIRRVLEPYIQSGVQCHALRTRQSGVRRFVSFHVLVPGTWTVRRGHRLLENVEADIRHAIPSVTVLTHLESLNDSASWRIRVLDRTETRPIESPAKHQRQPSDGDAMRPTK